VEEPIEAGGPELGHRILKTGNIPLSKCAFVFNTPKSFKMEQDCMEIIERKLLDDKRTKFRGTARVRFENLAFGRRDLNEKAVTYLEDKLKKQGILRLEPRHRIPAIIDWKVLEEAIEASPNTSSELLLENPEEEPPYLQLPSGQLIDCLQGLHRVAAAKKILPPGGWWWSIDLYINGTTNVSA
jgi:hypothetical protein